MNLYIFVLMKYLRFTPDAGVFYFKYYIQQFAYYKLLKKQ